MYCPKCDMWISGGPAEVCPLCRSPLLERKGSGLQTNTLAPIVIVGLVFIAAAVGVYLLFFR